MDAPISSAAEFVAMANQYPDGGDIAAAFIVRVYRKDTAAALDLLEALGKSEGVRKFNVLKVMRALRSLDYPVFEALLVSIWLRDPASYNELYIHLRPEQLASFFLKAMWGMDQETQGNILADLSRMNLDVAVSLLLNNLESTEANALMSRMDQFCEGGREDLLNLLERILSLNLWDRYVLFLTELASDTLPTDSRTLLERMVDRFLFDNRYLTAGNTLSALIGAHQASVEKVLRALHTDDPATFVEVVGGHPELRALVPDLQ